MTSPHRLSADHVVKTSESKVMLLVSDAVIKVKSKGVLVSHHVWRLQDHSLGYLLKCKPSLQPSVV